jgi:chaperonin GroES
VLDNGTRQEMTVKKQDRVLFSSYAGTEIKLDGQEMLILGEDEILAVID